MKRLWISLAVVCLASVAHGAVGKRDRFGYVGIDSIGAPALSGPFVSPSPAPPLSGNVDASGDDQIFSFSLGGTVQVYGSAFTGCYAHTNGILVCNSEVSAFFDNRPLPDSRFSGTTVIAPFWDDLAFVPGVSDISYQSFGDRVIVQWTDFARYDDPTARLTFRVTLQLASADSHGYVLFQYLKMTGRGADGSSATIGIQGSDTRNFNQYSNNMPGAIITGTAPAGQALQSILFDFDQDGDRLPGFMESVLGLDDTNPDFDGGGRDDGAELAAGLDPKVAGDDADPNDTDGDHIHDVSEAFYHTDPTKLDTDGDGINDDVEIRNDNPKGDRTFPDQADSDGDGFSDSVELDDGTDPRDPADFPTIPLSTDGNQHRPQAVVDGDGNIHVVSDNGASSGGSILGVSYWMLDSNGKQIIPQTLIKPPSSDATLMLRPASAFYAGKLYVVSQMTTPNGDQLGVVRLNPAAVAGMVPDAGIQPGQIVELNLGLVIPGVRFLHHQNIAVDASGIHVTYSITVDSGTRAHRSGIGYSHLDLDGKLLESHVLMTFPVENAHNPSSGSSGGVHHNVEAPIVLDEHGVAHVFIHAHTRAPAAHGNSQCSTCSGSEAGGLYYAAVSGGSVSGPFFLATPRFERHAVNYHDGLVFVTASGGHAWGTDVRLMLLDPAKLTVIPRNGDYYGVTAAIDPRSVRLPFTSVYTESDEYLIGSSMQVTDSGVVFIYYKHGDDSNNSSDACVLAVSTAGTLLAPPRCALDNVNAETNKGANLLMLPGNALGLVYCDDNSTGDLHFARFPISMLGDLSGVTPLNHAPTITSTAPTGSVYAGAAFAYAATASDPDSGQTMTWSLTTAPAGMTVDAASGAVSWTPAVSDLGSHDVTLQVCDNGSPSLCDSQSFTVNVIANAAPRITSVPVTQAVVGQAYAYQATAVDPQGEAITFALVSPMPAPGNMALTSDGKLTWTPTAADVGTLAVVLTATNTSALFDTQSFGITVTTASGGQHAPQFVSTPSDKALEGKTYTYQAVATDADNAAAKFTYTLKSTASGNLSLTTDGALTWTPKSGERGTVSVIIEAKEDDGELATQSFSVTVEPAGGGSGGCGCHVGASSETGGAWLVMLAIAIALGRRRFQM